MAPSVVPEKALCVMLSQAERDGNALKWFMQGGRGMYAGQ